MTSEYTNIRRHASEGGLLFLNCYRTEFAITRLLFSLPCISILHVPLETEVISHENIKIGYIHFSVEVLPIFV